MFFYWVVSQTLQLFWTESDLFLKVMIVISVSKYYRKKLQQECLDVK